MARRIARFLARFYRRYRRDQGFENLQASSMHSMRCWRRICFRRARTAAIPASVRPAAMAGCRSSSPNSAPSSAARITRNAAIRALCRRRPTARPTSAPKNSESIRSPGSTLRSAAAASVPICRSARPKRAARSPSAPACRKALRPMRSILSARSRSYPCPAKSAATPRTASRSSPASAVSDPMSGMARPTPISIPPKRFFPSGSTAL